MPAEAAYAVAMVALGGASGALARFAAGLLVSQYWKGALPLSTWLVNLIGCLLIGAAVGLFERQGGGGPLRYFAVVGFLGSFTTFSTFSVETIALLQDGRLGLALLNAGGSVVLGLLCVVAGMALVRP